MSNRHIRTTKQSGKTWYSLADISQAVFKNRARMWPLVKKAGLEERTILDLHADYSFLMRFIQPEDAIAVLRGVSDRSKFKKRAEKVADAFQKRIDKIAANSASPSVYLEQDTVDSIDQPHRVATRLDSADVTRASVTITQVNGEKATKSMNAVNESGNRLDQADRTTTTVSDGVQNRRATIVNESGNRLDQHGFHQVKVTRSGHTVGEMTDEELERANRVAAERYGITPNPKETSMTAAATQTQTYNFQGNDIRVVIKDGEPWFVLSDLAKVMEIKNVGDLRKRLDQEFIGQADLLATDGKKYKNWIINKANMYRVIMRSDKPEAIKFQNWVTDEVLVSIDKHGAYLTDQKIEEVLTDPDTIISLATQLKEERTKAKALEEEAREANFRLTKAAPKAKLFDEWMSVNDTILLGNAAKVLDQGRNIIGQNRLFSFLRDQGVLSNGGQRHNIPKQQFAKYFKVKTSVYEYQDGTKQVRMTPYIKPEGLAFVADLLRKNGYEI